MTPAGVARDVVVACVIRVSHSDEGPRRQTAVLLRSTHLQEATAAFTEACAIATQLASLQGRLAGKL